MVTDLDTTGSDPRANDPTLSGVVDNGDDSAAGLLVQFDHDGDAVPDGSAVTGLDGAFTYYAAGLDSGAVTLRARAKEYDQDSTAIYGAWFSLAFTLEDPPQLGYTVDQLSLWVDSGANGSDLATADPTVSGSIAVPDGQTQSALANLTIQFDHDSDGSSDGTALTDAMGAFTYTPAGLAEGIVTISARTLEAGWVSPWKELSFVHSSDPDGVDAQALVASLGSYILARDTAQTNYETTLDTAQQTYLSGVNTSQNTYDAQIAAALTAYNGVVDPAQSTYTSQTTAAESIFNTAMDTVGVDFSANLAAFTAGGGDATQYAPTDFHWPDAPQDNALDLANLDQPAPPVQSPSYSGQALDLAADPTYVSDLAAADAKHTSDRRTENNTHKTNLQTYKDAFKNGKIAADQVQQDKNTARQTEYEAAIANPTVPENLRLVGSADASYTSNYHDTAQADDQLTADLAANEEASLDDIAKSQARHDAAMAAAAVTYSPGSNEYNIAVAQIFYEHSIGVHTAIRVKEKLDAEAQERKEQRDHLAERNMSDARAELRQWLAEFKAQAYKDLQNDLAQYKQERDDAVAALRKTRHDAVAAENHRHVLARAAIDETQRNERLTAKLNAVTRYDTAQNTPFTDYLFDLAVNEQAFVANYNTLYTSYVTSLADATKTRANTLASARQTHSNHRALAAYQRIIGGGTGGEAIDGESQSLYVFKTTSADVQLVRDQKNADLWQTHQDEFSALNADYSIDLTNAERDWYGEYDRHGRDWTVANNQAEIDYNEALANANPDGSENAALLAQYNQDIQEADDDATTGYHVADRDKTLDQIDARDVRADYATRSDRRYEVKYHKAEKIWAHDISDGAATYQIGLADADRFHDVALVAAAGVRANTLAAGVPGIVSTVVSAQKTFTDGVATAKTTLAVNDAVAQTDFHVEIADLYVTNLGLWDTAEATHWSGYAVDLAQHERTFVNDLGGANVAFTSGLFADDEGLVHRATTADVTYAGSVASLVPAVTMRKTAAADLRAQNVERAQFDYAEKVALATAKHDKRVTSTNRSYQNTVSRRKEKLQNTVDDAEWARLRTTANNQYLEATQAITAAERTVMDNSAGQLQKQTVAAAEIAHANAVAAADQSRIKRTGKLHVVWSGDLKSAADSLASQTKSHTVVQATTNAAMDRFSVFGEAVSSGIRAAALAIGDWLHSKGLSTTTTTLNTALNDTQSTRRSTDASSAADYQGNLFSDHSIALAALAAASPDDHLLEYQADVAGEDLDWANDVKTEQNAFHANLTANLGSYTVDLNATDSTHSDQLGAANLVFGTDTGSADQNWLIGFAGSWIGWGVEMLTSDLSFLVGAVDKEATYDVDKTDTQREHDDNLATANVAWVADVMQIESDLYLGVIDQDTYNARKATADAEKQEKNDLAVRGFIQGVGNAAIKRAGGLGDVEIAYAKDTGSAWTTQTTTMNSAESGFSNALAGMINGWTGSAAAAGSAFASGQATADKSHIAALGTTQIDLQQGLGAANVANAAGVAAKEATYQIAQAAEHAESIVWMSDFFLRPQADAQAGWVANVAPDFIAFVTAAAGAEADFDDANLQAAVDLQNENADQSADYVDGVAPLLQTRWAGSVAQEQTYEDNFVTYLNTYMLEMVAADNQFALDSAEGMKEYAVGLAGVERDFRVGSLDDAAAAQTAKDAATIVVDDALALAQADANVTWTTGSADADDDFISDEATSAKEFSTNSAGIDRAYSTDEVGHAKTQEDIGGVSLADYWNGKEQAKSGRFLDKAVAQTNFKTAQYGHTVTAANEINTAVALPFSQFRADQAVAEAAWWNTASGDYLTFVAAVNAEIEEYQAAVGVEYVNQVGVLTTANVTRTTNVALAGEARTVSRATHAEGYIHLASAEIKTYLLAVATADRDLAAGGEQTSYDTARSDAADAYRTVIATADAQFELDVATADKTHTDALYGTDPASEGAIVIFNRIRDAALRDFDIFESTANADMLADVARLTHYDAATSTLGFEPAQAASYAAAMAVFATSTPSPWATQLADSSAAESARLASFAQEEAILAIAYSSAASDQSISAANAEHDATQSDGLAFAAFVQQAAQSEVDSTQESAPNPAATLPKLRYPAPINGRIPSGPPALEPSNPTTTRAGVNPQASWGSVSSETGGPSSLQGSELNDSLIYDPQAAQKWAHDYLWFDGVSVKVGWKTYTMREWLERNDAKLRRAAEKERARQELIARHAAKILDENPRMLLILFKDGSVREVRKDVDPGILEAMLRGDEDTLQSHSAVVLLDPVTGEQGPEVFDGTPSTSSANSKPMRPPLESSGGSNTACSLCSRSAAALCRSSARRRTLPYWSGPAIKTGGFAAWRG